MANTPEQYVIPSNVYAPNNSLPILVYRSVLPSPPNEDTTTTFLEKDGNGAWRKLGTWGHIAYRHFHPNVHECYGIFAGHSCLQLGRGENDSDGGIRVEVKAGDVIILPAGTGHACLESSEDYRYIGVYPKNGPKWRSEMGKNPHDGKYKAEIEGVRVPEGDPVFGNEGPMREIWSLGSKQTSS